MKFIIITILLFFVNNFAENLNIINSIKSKYGLITYSTILYNERNEYNVVVFSYDKKVNKTILEIFDKHNKCTFKKGLGEGYVMNSSVFRNDSKIFFFLNKLYLFNVNKLSLDSVDLGKKYTTIQTTNDILIANSEDTIDLYYTNGFDLLNSFKRKESIRWDLPKLHHNLIIFKNLQNEIIIINIENNETLETFNTGETEVRMLGIKIASAGDAISDYKINDNFLYFVTIGGSIYKYDIKLKKNVALRKSFMGDEHNAGLINNFQFADVNLDGIKDLIGAAVDNNIYCINGKDLSTIWMYNTGNENQHPLSLYDLNSDTVPEVFGVNYYDMKLFVIDGRSGELLYEKDDLNNKGEWSPTNVFVDDLNTNGNINIVCKSGLPGELIILELKR